MIHTEWRSVCLLSWPTVQTSLKMPSLDDYDVAMKRVRDLLDLDLEAEAAKEKTNEVMWAVFAAFIK